MARDLNHLQTITSAADLLAFLREDPSDRVLVATTDLSPDDFDVDGTALRMDDSLYAVVSMRAFHVTNTREMFCFNWRHGPPKGELVIIGAPEVRDRNGRVVPGDIRRLLSDAEERAPQRHLSRTIDHDSVWVLAGHPEAESDTK